MENISENKRKRGRPLKELYPGVTIKDEIKKFGNLLGDIKSERGKINRIYQIKAHAALRDQDDNCPIDGEFSFIISCGDNLDLKTYKQTILQELGRLEDEDLIREVAREICKYKLSTGRAITYIRQFRTGSQSTGDTFKLAIELGKTVDEYKLKHSSVNDDMIRAALNLISKVFPESCIFTIGYEKLTLSEFIEFLKKNDIEHVLDIRYSTKSQYKQDFKGSNLKDALLNEGISYTHNGSLGVPFYIQDPYKDLKMTIPEFKNEYLEHIAGIDIRELAKEIKESGRTALMCYERYATAQRDQKKDCHRSILANELKATGEFTKIIHL
jgi:hypothetical protein